MDDIQATELLLRRFTGDAQPDELAQLQDWIAQSEANAALARQLERTWALGRSQEPTLAYNADAHFERLKRRNAPPPAWHVQWGRRWMAIAATVAAAVAVCWWWLAPVPKMVEIVAETGDETKEITLPDGSHAWLNRHTRLRYPERFSAKARTVTLVQGDAFFDVQHNEAQPFSVETTLGAAHDLGTKFWVKIAAQSLEVAVQEGKVRLQPTQSRLFVDIVQNENAVYRQLPGTLTKSGDVNLNQLAWRRGTLNFTKTPLRKVFDDLAAYYSLENIDIANPSLGNCTFSGKLPVNASLDAFLSDLSKVYGFQYTMTNRTVQVIGGDCRANE